jgi:hypothetical protein
VRSRALARGFQIRLPDLSLRQGRELLEELQGLEEEVRGPVVPGCDTAPTRRQKGGPVKSGARSLAVRPFPLSPFLRIDRQF